MYRVVPDRPREYLLLDYGRHWDFPKGHVEKGEDDFSAASRELFEETGIRQIQTHDGFKRQVRYFFRDRKKGLIQKTVIFFLGRTKARPSEIAISHEHEGFAFLPFDLAIERLTFPTARQILQSAEDLLASSPFDPTTDTLSPLPGSS